MSKRSSKSSSSAGEFDVCAMSATSTPVKKSVPGAAAGAGSRSPSLSTTMNEGQQAASPGLRGGQPTQVRPHSVL